MHGAYILREYDMPPLVSIGIHACRRLGRDAGRTVKPVAPPDFPGDLQIAYPKIRHTGSGTVA